MSYQEKKTVVSIISGVLLLAAYCIYVFSRYASHMIHTDDMQFLSSFSISEAAG